MEIDGRKNKECSLKFIIIAITLSVIMIGLSIFLYIKYKDEKDYNLKLKEEFKQVDKELNDKKNAYEDELKNQTYYTNIDDEIEKEKEVVFGLIPELETAILEGRTNYKIAYLTFDDGPYYLTHSVLDVLRQKKVKATFFTIGLNKDSCFDRPGEDCSIMYKKIVDNGHTIANHTYSHLIFQGLYNSVDSFIYQVQTQENMIKERTGYKTNIVRFPGGSNTAGYLKNGIIERLRDMGYGWVDWTAQDGDGGNLTDTGTAWANLKSTINESIEVVLFHDYNYTTYSILPDFIDWLEQNNYIVLPLTYNSVKVNK